VPTSRTWKCGIRSNQLAKFFIMWYTKNGEDELFIFPPPFELGRAVTFRGRWRLYRVSHPLIRLTRLMSTLRAS